MNSLNKFNDLLSDYSSKKTNKKKKKNTWIKQKQTNKSLNNKIERDKSSIFSKFQTIGGTMGGQ